MKKKLNEVFNWKKKYIFKYYEKSKYLPELKNKNVNIFYVIRIHFWYYSLNFYK